MAQAGKTKEMDMLNGGLAGKLILFSIPLAASSILQQLFNSDDAWTRYGKVDFVGIRNTGFGDGSGTSLYSHLFCMHSVYDGVQFRGGNP